MSEPIRSTDPTTGRLLREYPRHSSAEVRAILERSATRQREWCRRLVAERVAPLRRLASLLRARADDLAGLAADEMGKPLADGRAEAEKCAAVCDYYAEHAAEMLRDRKVETDASASFVSYRPLGVVLAVMPWNFPFWQVFRFLAPNLAAGNAALLKHAENVSGCSLAIEAVVAEAGFPQDLFRSLLIGHDVVEELVGDARVAAVTLTGSTRAGREIAKLAGGALKPSVLELGGSDPYIVLADADLDLAVEQCVHSRLLNSGQSCIAAKRFIVVDDVREQFVTRFVAAFAKKRVGAPRDPATELGPLARVDLRDALHAQVTKSIELGADCLLGGKLPEGPGAFYPPTVLTHVSHGMPAYDEELFGPVAAILAARDETDAIRLANDSAFGLGAAVFTRDQARGQRIATEELHAGSCFVNAFVRSDPRLPFGGIGDSGYGRELAREGMYAFLNVKTVWVG